MRQLKRTLPLTGITVLDLTRLIPGAVCTITLADAGAEVIKVEEPSIGDYERQIYPFINAIASRFLILNRNKKSIVLNLKNERGREAFLKMVAKADVLVESFRPGAMQRLGLDYENLEQSNPRLIYCSISSFGQNGPYRDIVAHDINVLGESGFFSTTGLKDGPPVIPGLQIVDSVAGMNASQAILLSLIARNKTGRGRSIDISMFDCLLALMFDAAKYVFAGQEVPDRGKGRLYGGFPNYNLYQTLDGQYITVGALETKFKNLLLQTLGRQDLVTETSSATSSKLEAIDTVIEKFLGDVFKTRTRDEWVEIFSKINICVGPVNSMEEGINHPQTRSRRMVFEAKHPKAGLHLQLGSPMRSTPKLTEVSRLPAPNLGENSREILQWAGYNPKEIDSLMNNNVSSE